MHHDRIEEGSFEGYLQYCRVVLSKHSVYKLNNFIIYIHVNRTLCLVAKGFTVYGYMYMSIFSKSTMSFKIVTQVYPVHVYTQSIGQCTRRKHYLLSFH